MSRAAYDAFARAVESELGQAYREWEWDIARYGQLPFADTHWGPPPWIRITAWWRVPGRSITLRHKHWISTTGSVAATVAAIGAWMEHTRGVEVRERDRRAHLLANRYREAW